MPTIIKTPRPAEEGTCFIDLAFWDEDGAAKAPKTAKWSLTDNKGNLINNRDEVAISSPSATETVVLSGDDLALQAGEREFADRIFTIEWTYDSALGSDLPDNDKVEFQVDGSVVIPRS